MRRNALLVAQQFAGFLILAGVMAAIAGGAFAYDKWQLQSTVWSEKARVEAKLPFRVNNYVTLVGVRAGLLSLTRTYRLARMRLDITSFERSARRNICAAEVTKIKNGISFTSEYQGWSGDQIARIEVTSCP